MSFWLEYVCCADRTTSSLTFAGRGWVVGVAGHKVSLPAKASLRKAHSSHVHILSLAAEVVLGNADKLALLVSGVCCGSPAIVGKLSMCKAKLVGQRSV